jgi:hypothetical protein
MGKQDIRLFDLGHETVHLCTHESICSCRRCA